MIIAIWVDAYQGLPFLLVLRFLHLIAMSIVSINPMISTPSETPVHPTIIAVLHISHVMSLDLLSSESMYTLLCIDFRVLISGFP